MLTETEYTYDGDMSLLRHKMTENIHTTYSTGNYSMTKGRLTEQKVTHTRIGESSIARKAAFEYYDTGPQIGLLKKETVEPDKAAFMVETEHLYDTFGNRIQSKVTAGGVTRSGERVEYDYLGRYPSKVYDYRTGGTETGETEYLKTHFVSRDKFGTPTQIRHYTYSASNYVTERVATTPLGQVYFRSDSTGQKTIITLGSSHSLCPSGDKTYRYERIVEQGGTTSLNCYDHQGRVVRAGAVLLSGTWSGVDREYDPSGRLVHETRPFYLTSGTRYWTSTEYDVLSRPTDVQNPDGSSLQISYSGGWKYVTNELGQTRSEKKNPLGQVVQAVGELPGTDITYEYDPRGNLETMTGPAGTIELEYDLLDRKKRMDDPDKGIWSYEYNHFGELTCQTNANGHRIVNRYDRRGRLFNRRDATGGTCASPSGITSNTTWKYDTASNGYGQLALITDTVSNYQQELYYDSFGRVRQTRTRLPGVNNQLDNHYEKITYNQYGQVFQIFDAARNGTNYNNNAVQHVYKNGYLEKVIDAVHVGGTTRKTYYQATQTDVSGNITRALYGNGVTQRASYDPKTGRVRNLNATNVMGQYLQRLALEWDEVGNLENRRETGIGSGIGARDLKEFYYYDGMNRLQEWSTVGVYNGLEVYQYDAKDNLTNKSGVGSYKYGTQCASSQNAGPHAVCQAGGSNYSYDNNGNQISGGGRTLTYSVFDKPLSIIKGSHTTEFRYGPDRSRYKRTDTNGSGTTTTLYLGNVEKIHYPNNTVQWKRTIAGGVAVLTQTFNSSGSLTKNESHYLIKDHLGTLSLITDHMGAVTHELYSDPWGQPIKPEWDGHWEYNAVPDTPYLKLASTVTLRGFTGHEHLDEVGIVHMNGRIYDPRLARFMQADPVIQDPTTPRSLNRYSYVWNNPLNATDPSGYSREEEAEERKEETRRLQEQDKAQAEDLALREAGKDKEGGQSDVKMEPMEGTSGNSLDNALKNLPEVESIKPIATESKGDHARSTKIDLTDRFARDAQEGLDRHEGKDGFSHLESIGDITFENDLPGGPHTDRAIDTDLVNALHTSLDESGLSVNVNSTTGGHGVGTPHHNGKALDINQIGGVRVQFLTDNGLMRDVVVLQRNLMMQAGVIKVFGPVYNHVKVNGNWVQARSHVSLQQSHGNHIHVQVE